MVIDYPLHCVGSGLVCVTIYFNINDTTCRYQGLSLRPGLRYNIIN